MPRRKRSFRPSAMSPQLRPNVAELPNSRIHELSLFCPQLPESHLRENSAHPLSPILPVGTACCGHSALVDQTRDTLLSGGARHNLHVDLPPDLPRVMADEPGIVQVLNKPLLQRVPKLSRVGSHRSRRGT